MAKQPDHLSSPLMRRLGRTRLVTRAAIVVERLWPLVLPILIVAALFLSLSWLGIFRIVPEWARLGLLGLLGLAALASLWPLSRFRAPRAHEVDRRIEAANALRHAPVSVQTDRLSSSGDAFADALWREHRKRMADGLGRLSGDLPRTGVPERDPWGLRAAVALLLVVAFAFSYGPLGGRLTDGFSARGGVPAIPPRIDAWVTPPTYTGRAPIFLTADANAARNVFSVPEGSAVALRITGGSGSETLAFFGERGTETIEPEATPASAAQSGSSARQFATTLQRDGVLALMEGDAQQLGWTFQVVPDHAPVIRFAEEPGRAVNGTLDLRYEIEDDYGAVSAVGEFRQADEAAADARPLYPAPDMALTLPRRDGRSIAARTTRDLTEHPWAGSRVRLSLKAVDAAGQEGRSEEKTIILPERPFSNPLARALVEQRRLLALDANAKPRVGDLMDAIMLRPEDTFDNLSHYLGLSAARTQLAMADSDDALRAVADYLWEMALAVEDGGLTDAERRLRQAQEALRQGLENGASDEEIDRLMSKLRQAMNDFLREFAERAARDPNMARQQMPQGQELRQSDLDRMLDQIENLAKSGSRDQAQQLLSQLQDMMNNLQMGQNQQGQQGGQQSQMRQQMDKLGEMMRRQQELMNETFRLDQMQRGQQGQQGQQGQMSPEEFAEAMRQLQEGQGQLQGQLDELMRGLEGMGIKPGEGFGDAGQAMGRAEQSLGQSEGERAVGEQGQALEALRRGAQDMMQQMQQAQQGEQGEGQQGRRQQGADRDPLGRPRATTGPDFGESVNVPDEIDTQRARRILEEIRRRLGNALSPELERNYLERLLEMR